MRTTTLLSAQVRVLSIMSSLYHTDPRYGHGVSSTLTALRQTRHHRARISPLGAHRRGARVSRAHFTADPSDSVSHLKTSLMGNSITVPISNGKLLLGTWQGLCLAEFRHSGGGWGSHGAGRKVVATIL